MMHRTCPIFTAGLVAALAPNAWADTAAAATGADALTVWLTGITVYLCIGALLAVIATANDVRERRAWSALLRWEDDGDENAGDGAGEAGSRNQAA
jgi:hypothetical protein